MAEVTGESRLNGENPVKPYAFRIDCELFTQNTPRKRIKLVEIFCIYLPPCSRVHASQVHSGVLMLEDAETTQFNILALTLSIKRAIGYIVCEPRIDRLAHTPK
ncbi:hypothetical protein AA313_de0205537 [Arthrobotrys entomopaga]|nr:hypothetical protein AA313_de0205537 [Arthrobotrys entomopaga]